MSSSSQKKILDTKLAPAKRFSSLCKFTDGTNKEEIKSFYATNFSEIYKIFLDHMQALDTAAKPKKKTIDTKEVLQLASVLLNLMKHARNVIQKRWQQRSITKNLEVLLVDNVVFAIRKTGFELLLNFVDIMQDQDPKVLDLLMHCLDFKPFIENNVKLPNFDVREIKDDEMIRLAVATAPQTEAESLELFTLFFTFIKTQTDQFDFWWKFFKLRVAPILYPNECKSLELLNKLDDMGFTMKCPYKIHLLVLDMILDSLESPKKSDILYQSDKDIYLFLLIFRQSFLLPPQHFEALTRMLKTYRSWICKDYFLYSWPQIMEKSRNVYFRVFIDNLSQTFFMKGDESYVDLHVQMCYEVFEIFMFFTNIEDKLEFETWSDLLLALIRIYNHLIQRTKLQDKYDQEYGKMLERTCIRNLFILWMRAHPENKYTELWDSLYELLQTHFGVESVFSFWRHSVLNLTNAIIKKVFVVPDDFIAPYLPYDTEIVEFQKKNKKIKTSTKGNSMDLKSYYLEIPLEITLHLWHKMFVLYGRDNTQTSNGALHAQKIKVISEVIDILLNISNMELKPSKGETAPPFLHAPEANRILDLFGEWLVEACSRDDQAFADAGGRYSAYVSFCKIMCQKCSQPVAKRYLAEFYRVIHIGLTVSSTPKVIEAIVLNSYRLFSMGHPGVNMLIPDYVKAIEPILKDNSSASDPLKMAAIHAITASISVCYYYENRIFPSLDGADKGEETEEKAGLRSCKRLRGKICQILMGAVQDGRSPECQVRCFWGLILCVMKELTQQKSTGTVKFVLDSLLSFLLDKTEKVAIGSHYALMSLASLDLIQYLEEASVKSLVTQICNTITSTLNEGKLVRGNTITHLFYTLVEIIVHIPKSTLEQPPIATALFDAIAAGLTCMSKAVDDAPAVDDKKKKPVATTAVKQTKTVSTLKSENAKIIAEAAEVLLSYVLNMYSHFPVPTGASIISSNKSEMQFLQEAQGAIAADPRIHYFMFNNTTVLTIFESPDANETARVVMRDMTGRYVWDCKLSLTESASLFPKIKKEAEKTEEEKKQEQTLQSTKAVEAPQAVETTQEQPQEQPQEEQREQSQEQEQPQEEQPEEVPSDTVQEEEDILPTPSEEDGLLPTPNEEVMDMHNYSTTDDSHLDAQPSSPTTVEAQDSQAPEEEPAEQQQQNGEEEQQDDEDDVGYPHYDPLIDTDKTDMLEVLQHYVSQQFPIVSDYAAPSVIRIPAQNIPYDSTQENLVEQHESELKLLEETSMLPFELVQRRSKQESAVYRVFRALLSNTGFLSMTNRPTLSRIDTGSRFFRALKQLDKISERETIKIGVIYVKNEQELEKQILRNEDASPLFSEFLQSLGWDIDLKTHLGFLGGLDNSDALSTGTIAPYYSNGTTEVVFHAIPNMPTKQTDAQQIHKKRHVGNDFVHIVWSEHDRDYRPWTIVSQFNYAHIVIYPLKDPLFRIQIFTKPDVPLFGPLLDGMVVDKQHLGPLVRLTAINANKAIRYAQQGYKKPYPTRKDAINDIADKYKKTLNNEMFLQPLFFEQMGKLEVRSAGSNNDKSDEAETTDAPAE